MSATSPFSHSSSSSLSKNTEDNLYEEMDKLALIEFPILTLNQLEALDAHHRKAFLILLDKYASDINVPSMGKLIKRYVETTTSYLAAKDYLDNLYERLGGLLLEEDALVTPNQLERLETHHRKAFLILLGKKDSSISSPKTEELIEAYINLAKMKESKNVPVPQKPRDEYGQTPQPRPLADKTGFFSTAPKKLPDQQQALAQSECGSVIIRL